MKNITDCFFISSPLLERSNILADVWIMSQPFMLDGRRSDAEFHAHIQLIDRYCANHETANNVFPSFLYGLTEPTVSIEVGMVFPRTYTRNKGSRGTSPRSHT